MIWDKFLVVNRLHQILLFFLNPPPLPNAKPFGGTGFLGGTRQQWFLSLKTRRKEGRWKAQHGEDRKQCTSARLRRGHTQSKTSTAFVNLPGHLNTKTRKTRHREDGSSFGNFTPDGGFRHMQPLKVLIYKLYQTLAAPTPARVCQALSLKSPPKKKQKTSIPERLIHIRYNFHNGKTSQKGDTCHSL